VRWHHACAHSLVPLASSPHCAVAVGVVAAVVAVVVVNVIVDIVVVVVARSGGDMLRPPPIHVFIGTHTKQTAKARESQRKPAKASESQRKPAKASESQRKQVGE
jgi:hypothetical protein